MRCARCGSIIYVTAYNESSFKAETVPDPVLVTLAHVVGSA